MQEKYDNREDVDSDDLGRLYVESFAKFKNPNPEMAQAFVERNVDGVIAEAKAMQSGEPTDINSDLQSTAEASPALTEAEQKIVNTPDDQLTPEQRAVKENIIERQQKNIAQNSDVKAEDVTDVSNLNIRVGMSEDERADILRDKTVELVEANHDFDEEFDFEYLSNNIKSKVEKGLLKTIKRLGFLTQYNAPAIGDIGFTFTAGGFRKSLNSQESAYGGDTADFAKVVLNLKELLNNAILVETHIDKGKGTSRENQQLKQVYVLMSVLQDENKIIPVQFEIKQYVDENNRLYLAVALTKTEIGVMGNTILDKGQASTYLLPISNISIPELFSKINPSDRKFLKYIPDEFLSQEQKEAKSIALREDEVKYGRLDPSTPDGSQEEGMTPEQAESGFDEPSAEFPERDFIADWAAQVNGSERHSDGQRRIIEIGRKMGYRIVFDKNLRTRLGALANGKIDRKNKTIYINPNSNKAIQFIFKHELTHYLEQNFASYAEFANAVMDSKAFKSYVASRGFKSTTEFNEALVLEYTKAGIENFGEAEANYEMVADFVGDCLFGKSERLSVSLLECVGIEQRKTFAEKVKEFFAKIKQLFSKDRKISADIKKLEKQFADAFKAVEQKENTAGDSGESYSIASFPDGKQFVIVETEQERFDDLTPDEMRKEAKKIIKKRFVGKVIGNKNRAFVKSRTAAEYSYPAKFISDPQIIEAKMRASSELDNLVDAGQNYRNEPDGKDGHFHPEATGGFDYYDTVFKIGNSYFYGLVNIMVTDNGKVLRDITKIEDITNDIITQYGNNPQGEFVGNSSNDSISEKDSSVNTNFMQDDEEYSLPLQTSAENLLEMYEKGELTRQEYLNMLKKQTAMKPAEIADLTEDDANTTPPMKRKQGVNKGDKQSKFYESLLNSDIFDQRFKNEVKTDTFIERYKSISNKETLRKAAAELSEVLTRAGQVVQSARMFKKMTPLGRVMTVQKMADVIILVLTYKKIMVIYNY